MAGELPQHDQRGIIWRSDEATSAPRPVIRITRAGQYSVRFGHVYKVFLTYEQAYRYAGTLSSNVPVVVDTKPSQPQVLLESGWVMQSGEPKKQIAESETTSDFLHKAVLKRALDYTYTSREVCIACIIGVYGTDGGPTWQEDTFYGLQQLLRRLVDIEKVVPVRSIDARLVRDILTHCNVGPEIKDKPDGTLPKGCGGLSEPQVSDNHVKKKRTIRKLTD